MSRAHGGSEGPAALAPGAAAAGGLMEAPAPSGLSSVLGATGPAQRWARNEPLEDVVRFDPGDATLQRDVLDIILQHLDEQGMTTAAYALRDEAKMRERDRDSRRKYWQMQAAVLGGDWEEVNRLLGKATFKNQRSFHYALARQQYLELIEAGDGSKAFTFLKKKLKPLEGLAPTGEFEALAYLLTCKSVSEAPGRFFSGWQEDAARQRLVADFRHLLDPDSRLPRVGEAATQPGRLWRLLHQACGYQVLSQPHYPPEKPTARTLLRDYLAPLCPNVCAATLPTGEATKCCAWLRLGGDLLAHGGTNGSFHVWKVDPLGGAARQPCRSFGGHTGRVWDVCPVGDKIAATSSGDGTVRIWDTSDDIIEGDTATRARATLQGHARDVYAVRGHPGGGFVASGGYDGSVRLWDIEQQQEVRRFAAHRQAVTCVAFNHYGNLVVSGSKDGTVRFWEAASGVCLTTLTTERTPGSAELAPMAPVTSVDLSPDGGLLLVGHQDSSNRLWELSGSGQGPSLRHYRLQGHTNICRSYIRSCFGPGGFVFGGSEDGSVCIWAAHSGELVSRLLHGDNATPMPVYDVRWCQASGQLASCGGDRSIRLWAFDASRPYVTPRPSHLQGESGAA
eukprot:TRINITY_DN32374_c0_g1_i1.p2 TRINITY_DN32374_c0_g1~~TRINITY_DN32374_c0_g1_i1.p2  ORF type:complete len:621 (+),score=187.68 TRINITY_DN32374_c0_g1_i1:115-1977(+)